MPTFTPINLPASPEARADNVSTDQGKLARIDEQIRECIQTYKSALRSWSKGMCIEALKELESLAADQLVSHTQSLHAEQECSAYCNEYSGMSVDRFRSLVFGSIGALVVEAEVRLSDHCTQLKEIGSPTFDFTEIALCGRQQAVVRKAMAFLDKAFKFGGLDAAKCLLLGQCAAVLGRFDIAAAAFGNGINTGTGRATLPSLQTRQQLLAMDSKDHVFLLKRLRPSQWWCISAIYNLSLLRGDLETASAIANILQLAAGFSNPLAQLNSYSTTIPLMPHASPVPLPYIADRTDKPAAFGTQSALSVLVVKSRCGSVSLSELGGSILQLFYLPGSWGSSAKDGAPNSSIPYAVQDIGSADMQANCQESDISSARYGDMSDREDKAADSKHTSADAGDADAHKEATENGDSARIDATPASDSKSTKRRESFSGDEMPVKRRSTRVIERSNTNLSGAMLGSNTAAQSAATNRSVSSRSGVKRYLTMSTETADSAAFDSAQESVSSWLLASGIADRELYAHARISSHAIAAAVAHQTCAKRHRVSHGVASNDNSEPNLSEWCLDTKPCSGKQAGSISSDGTAEHAINIANGSYQISLHALIKGQTGSQLRLVEAKSVASDGTVPASICQKLLEGNGGAVSLLIRYMDALVALFYTDPGAILSPGDLNSIALQALETAHEVLVDWVFSSIPASTSADDHQKPLACATFALLLLTSAIVHKHVSVDAYSYMRSEWVQIAALTVRATSVRTSSRYAVEYRLVEAWTNYEVGVLSNDVSSATRHIAECHSLLSDPLCAIRDGGVARCSLSGAPVTLGLVEQRMQHLELFQSLIEAQKVADTDAQQAIELLSPIVASSCLNPKENSLSFSQLVSATRLLRTLYNRQMLPSDEAQMVLRELCLYVSRLSAEHRQGGDTALPVYAVIERCCALLRRLHTMVTSDHLVRQSLVNSIVDGAYQKQVLMLACLSLAIIHRFAPDSLPECSAASPEAVFAGLSMWLVGILASPAFVQKPAPQPAEKGAPELAIKDCQADTDSNKDAREPAESEMLDQYTAFLALMHEVLGERGLCTAAGGAFLKQLLSACQERLAKDRDSLAYWDVAASCLRCLYDIKLYSSETSLHTSEHLDMDADSANAIYLLVEPELLDAVRNRKGVGLRSDLKAVVDKATNALGELDLTRYPHVSMNADAVDSYLDGTAMPTFAQIRNVLCCVSADSPTLNIPMIEVGSSSGIPAAHLTLPFVRAAAQHELLRQRMKSGMARAVEDYDVIIDDYKLNLALNVNSSEGWLHLGLAYADLADEALLGTANEIVESKHDIAVLQRSALACLIQAMQFLPPSQGKNASKENEDEDEDEDDEESNELARKLHVRVFSLSGLLLYRIASSPLSLLAFKVLPSNVLVSDDEVDDSQHWDLGKWCSRNDSVKQLELSRSLAKRFDPPPRDYVYRLARRMFARASDLDSSNWKWSYMLGKSMSKLGDRLSACACYLKACHVVSRRSGSSISSATGVQQNAPSTANASATELPLPPSSTQPSFSAIADVAVDAHYKLLSSIAKMLCASKIDVPTARRFLTAMPYALPAEEDCIDRAVAAHGSATEDICLDTDPKPLSDDVLSILKQIRAAVVQMCSADKRRWHHRPYYLLAWIDVRIVNSHEQAKQTLLSLLQMRNSTKQLASFYKTEFEAPGKHYLYLEKYLKLYVEVLVSTSDIEGIQLLQRKLKRSSESLYDPSELATMASEAEIKILQKLTSRLNCPRLVVDELQKEHIILEHALAGVDRTRIFSITRHCRLNRSQFNHARDLAKDNISHFTALREHLNRVLRTLPASAPEDAGVSQNAELQLALQTVDQYLDCARNATQLFAYLLEQKKKHAEDYANISTLNDCMADLYILLLYTYGQDNCILHLPPHQEGNVDSLVSLCRESTAPIAASLRAQRPEGAFWHGIIFDEARNESSQQYKLLNPLLEFCINKLLDSVREAESLKANRFVCLASVDSGSSLPAPPAAAAPTSSSSAN